MRKRLTRREKRSRNKKIVLMSSICLLLCLCVGYAAFSTQLSLRAKGNIKKFPITGESLKKLVVTSGDGLYKDEYEEGRYIYKGANPNNYIEFNNEMWRILSVESDGSLKIIRNDLLDNVAYDTSDGCSVAYLHEKDSKDKNYVDNIIFLAPSPSVGGCVYWDNPATLNAYLNGEYFDLLIDKDKIVNHDWFIGPEKNSNDLNSTIIGEKSRIWNGKIGLINQTEYIRTNSNVEQCGSVNKNNQNEEICKTTNWLFIADSAYWTLTLSVYNQFGYVSIIDDGNISFNVVLSTSTEFENTKIYSRPTLYLTPDTTLSGTGTESEPFTITN